MGKSLHFLGGTARSKTYEKWKATKWTVELHENEVVLPSGSKRKLRNENVILESKKESC